MTDLRGIARRLHLSIEQIRIVADLLEQGYQPSFIERYRADETGNLPRGVLWALKLEVDRQQRLAESREKATSQLPKDASLDEEVESFLANSLTEAEMEMAMRCWRARRNHAQAPQRDVEAEQLLEKMIAYSGDGGDIPSWVASEMDISAEAAQDLLERTQRLVGTMMSGDTSLALKLRKALQKNAKLKIEYVEASQEDGESVEEADVSSSTDTSANADSLASADIPASDETQQTHSLAESTDASTPANIESTSESSDSVATAESASSSGASSSSDEAAATETTETTADTKPEQEPSAGSAAAVDSTGEDAASDDAASAAETAAETSSTSDANAEENVIDATTASKSESGDDHASDLTFSKRSKKEKTKSKPATKSLGKLTPRQRRRRWLLTMIQSMKSLKRSIGDLTAFQQLMLGKARRSQIIKTNLQYDDHLLTGPARDIFVSKQHPFSKWFERAAKEALDHSIRSKVEIDALTHLEEQAQEKLLETSTTRLRQTLMQRPVRGHVVMVVDTVGPNSASVAVVGPGGGVLHTDEVACSAKPEAISRNVIHLGEIAHRFRVTLVALTNGPARRFLVLTLKELMRQSADSGLRWTMADRGGADAYAVGRVALRELPAHNRRDRAAIWVARCLQDPLNELLKLDVNRLRLGSFQRELPQEPLKKLVRETIADCICSRGIDTHLANVEGLKSIAGVGEDQALQIVELASKGDLKSRSQLLSDVKEWPEKASRQAIGFLRVFGSEQPLDATLIHPDDYRLADRLVSNTELETPANAPPNWRPPEKADESKSAADVDAAQDSGPAVESESFESSNEAASSEATSETTSDLESASSVAETEAVSAETEASTETKDASAEDTTPASDESGEATDTSNSEATDSDSPDTEAASEEPTGSEGAASEASDTSDAASTGSGSEESSGVNDLDALGGKPEYSDEVAAAQGSGTKATKIDIEKHARGWQVGREKLRWIANCLEDPFGDPRLSQTPVPMLKDLPSLSELKPGTCLWAVVVGVADFGAFVELAPECSGLIHISRLSADYVEDPHQVVQVGDLLMVWVVSVDESKNRVALTALSPEQRAQQERSNPERGGGRQQSDRGGKRYGGRSSESGDGRGRGQGGSHSGSQNRGSQNRGGQGRGGQGGGRGPGRDGGQGRGGKPGGRGGKSFGGRHGKGRGQGGPKQPKTVVVESKKPVDPISSAMKEGDEPLRSFSDLMQFYEAKRTDDVPAPKSEVTPKSEASKSGSESASTDGGQSSGSDAEQSNASDGGVEVAGNSSTVDENKEPSPVTAEATSSDQSSGDASLEKNTGDSDA